MTTIEIRTSGTHCASCSMLIEMNVGDLSGVASVSADFASSNVTVDYDPAHLTAEEILDEIRKAGYGAELIA